MTQQPDQNQGGQPAQGQTPQPQDQEAAQQQAAHAYDAQQNNHVHAQPAPSEPGPPAPSEQGRMAQPQGYAQQVSPQQAHAQYQQVPYQQGYDQGVQYGQHPYYAQQGSAPSAASAQGTGYVGHQGYQQGYAHPQAPRVPKEKNFFAALFDFSFQKPVTEKYARFFFFVVAATIAFYWLIITVFAFADGNRGPSYDPWSGVVSLLFGPLLVLVAIILVRVFFENTISTIRAAEKLKAKED